MFLDVPQDTPELRRRANAQAAKVFQMLSMEPVTREGKWMDDNTYTYQTKQMDKDGYRGAVGVWISILEEGGCVVNVRPMEAQKKDAPMIFMQHLDQDKTPGAAFIRAEQSWMWSENEIPKGNELQPGYRSRVITTFNRRSSAIKERTEATRKVNKLTSTFKFAENAEGRPEVKGERCRMTITRNPNEMISINTGVTDPRVLKAIMKILDEAELDIAENNGYAGDGLQSSTENKLDLSNLSVGAASAGSPGNGYASASHSPPKY